MIRALFVVMAISGTEGGGCGVKHPCHLIAVNGHAVCGLDGARPVARFEQAGARIGRHCHLHEQDRGDQKSANISLHHVSSDHKVSMRR